VAVASTRADNAPAADETSTPTTSVVKAPGKVPDQKLCDIVREVFPLKPRGIIEYLDLRRPIYRKTAAGGHFGREGFPWEKTDRSSDLQKAAGKG
jgi:S-adenosylmethionine synthetase